MPTPLTWVSTPMGPTTLWVSGRDARAFLAQGWELDDYEPSQEWLRGVGTARVRVVKPGSEYTHVWSPQLAALHERAMWAYDDCRDGLRYGPVWRRLSEGHGLLMGKHGYHERLIFVPRWDPGPLEPVQARVVAGIRAVADEVRGQAGERARRWADLVERWAYRGTG